MSREQEAATVAFAIERDFFAANFAMSRLMRLGGNRIRTIDFRHAKNAFVALYLDTIPILAAKGVDLTNEQIDDPALAEINAFSLYQNFKVYTTLLFKTGVLTQDRLNRAQQFLAGQPQPEVTSKYDY